MTKNYSYDKEYVYWIDNKRAGQIFAPTKASRKREIIKLIKKGFKKEK